MVPLSADMVGADTLNISSLTTPTCLPVSAADDDVENLNDFHKSSTRPCSIAVSASEHPTLHAAHAWQRRQARMLRFMYLNPPQGSSSGSEHGDAGLRRSD